MSESLFDSPKLTLVQQQPAPAPAQAARSGSETQPRVLVEPQADGQYIVSRLRHGGTTSAAVLYTREELLELYARIPPALKVGG